MANNAEKRKVNHEANLAAARKAKEITPLCLIARKRFARVVKVMPHIGFEIPGYEQLSVGELKALLIHKCEQRNGRPTRHTQQRPGYHNHHVIPCHRFPLKREDPAAHVPENLLWVTVPQHQVLHLLDWVVEPRNDSCIATVKRWAWKADGTRKPANTREKFAPGEVAELTGIPDKPRGKTKDRAYQAKLEQRAAKKESREAKKSESARKRELKKTDLPGYMIERAMESISRPKYSKPLGTPSHLAGVRVSDFVYRVYLSINARLNMGEFRALSEDERRATRRECISRLLKNPPADPHAKGDKSPQNAA